jgi:hypothetical protein
MFFLKRKRDMPFLLLFLINKYLLSLTFFSNYLFAINFLNYIFLEKTFNYRGFECFFFKGKCTRNNKLSNASTISQIWTT